MQLEQLLRDEWGRLLALLVTRSRRLDLAEDALADAFESAARTWPTSGEPANPVGWLFTTANRRIIDRLRAESMAARKMPLLALDDRHTAADLDPQTGRHRESDDLLRLVLLAAHPALAPEAGAALTLRLVLGISTADIARLFLVSESTMAARLTRAKKKVVSAGIPLAIPEPEVLPHRLDVVAQVAYLAFTSGYAPGSGPDVMRVELAGEAIRLVRLIRSSSSVAQTNSSLTALLALMLFHHSRRRSRINAEGEPVRLPDQDRSAWDKQQIAEAQDLLARLVDGTVVRTTSKQAASYLLQALIAGEHARAQRPQDTDWVTIADLYLQLDEVTGSPVVRMNRAVAVAEAGDPEAALGLVQGLEEHLPASHRLAAVTANLLTRTGERAAAALAYDRAIALCDNDAERSFLVAQRAEISPDD